jgi:hypothetical protein
MDKTEDRVKMVKTDGEVEMETIETRPLLDVAMIRDVVGVLGGLEAMEGMEARAVALGTCVRVRQAELGATAAEEGTVDEAAAV